jgi:hypothetical protein
MLHMCLRNDGCLHFCTIFSVPGTTNKFLIFLQVSVWITLLWNIPWPLFTTSHEKFISLSFLSSLYTFLLACISRCHFQLFTCLCHFINCIFLYGSHCIIHHGSLGPERTADFFAGSSVLMQSAYWVASTEGRGVMYKNMKFFFFFLQSLLSFPFSIS